MGIIDKSIPESLLRGTDGGDLGGDEEFLEGVVAFVGVDVVEVVVEDGEEDLVGEEDNALVRTAVGLFSQLLLKTSVKRVSRNHCTTPNSVS